MYFLDLFFFSVFLRTKNLENYHFPINTRLSMATFNRNWFCSVVVITSALHAEGRRFEPGREQMILFFDETITCYLNLASSLKTLSQ